MDVIANLQQLLARGKDSALLRFSLGNEYLKQGDAASAVTHLEQVVAQDPAYSAAWKLLGRALADSGQNSRAIEAYRQGIRVAEGRGDKQAAREMGVFVKRLMRSSGDPSSD